MDAIEQAAQILKDGGLVSFATETVYGLGAHALDVDAVAKVFEAKRRPRFDPLIVHVADLAAARTVTRGWPAEAELLAEVFWPGPLTLVLKKAEVVPDLVTAGLDTVAVRVPAHPLAQQLLRAAEIPLAAPSANPFGTISPTTAAHVQASFPELMVLDGGPCTVGVESTIVSFAGDKPTLLRCGGLAEEDIEKIIGPLQRLPVNERTTEAPGRQLRHYAPTTPLVLSAPSERPKNVAYLAFRDAPQDASQYTAVEILSATGEPREAAAQLFAALRRLDASGAELIIAESAPDEGLGRAINDRLQRASKRGE